jgi:hypothetical protein
MFTLLAGCAVFVPAATRARVVYSSTPNPPPLFELTLLRIQPAQTACTRGIVLNSDAEMLRIYLGAFGRRPAVPVTLRLTGAGYATTRPLPDYSPDGSLVDVSIPRPTRTTPAMLCLSNRGTRPISLGATTESRTRSRTSTSVDGKPTLADPTIQLLRREPRSFASMLPTLMERAATFKPGFVAPWLLWALAAVLVVGLPFGAMLALAVEPRQRHAESAELQEDEPAEHGRGIAATPPAREGVSGGGDPDRHQ